MTDLLRVRGLRKSYGDKVVLHDIDLDVAAGDVVCLIGSSGSGKSTLLRCLNLLEETDDGLVELDGVDISDPRVDRRAVRSRMADRLPGLQPVPAPERARQRHPGAPQGARGRPAGGHDRARELLRRFGLGDKADAHPDQLSGGQQQRAALVRALAPAPSLLLLDEITAALDPELVGDVLDAVRALGGRHRPWCWPPTRSVRPDVANRICFLDGGRILEAGPPEEIFTAPREERTRQFLRRVLAD